MNEHKTFLGFKLSHLAIAFCLLFVANTAITGLPPTTLQGLWDTVKTTTFNFFAPNYQITTVNGGRLIETGNKNILKNGDFENSASAIANFTCSTVTPAVETTSVISGKQSIIMSPSAQTFECYQDATLYASNFQGSTQLLAMVWIRTNQSGIKVCSRNDGVTSTTNCVTVAPQSPSVWQLIKVPFISSSTSNGISIAASSSITGNVYIDDAFVGAVDLKTDVSTVTAWQAYTPTYTGFGTVTGSEMQWRQVGGNVEIRGKFTSGTSTAVEARISLPNSYSSSGSSVIPSIQMAGKASYSSFSTTYFSESVLIEPSVSYVTLGVQSSSSSEQIKANGNALLGAGTTMHLFASVPVAGLQGVTSIYSASCGANCVDTFSFKSSSTGVVSGENVDVVNGNCAVTDTSLYTCTFNTGIFTVAPNCVMLGDQYQSSLVSTSATTVVYRSWDSSTGKAAAGFQVICQKQGADFIASRTITGSFAEVMTTPGVSRPVERTGVINCDASSSITSQKGTAWISSVGNITGNGDCTTTLVAGSFSDTPDCQMTRYAPAGFSTGISVGGGATSSTSILTDAEDDAGTTATDYDVTLTCKGSL